MPKELVSQETQEEVSQDASEETSAAAAGQQAESAEDPESSEEESEQAEEREPERKPRKGGFQRRIDRLTEEKRYLESLVQQLAGKQPAAPQSEPEVKPQQGKPKATDFESYDDYVEAIGRWGAEQRLSEERANVERWTQQQRQQQQIADWESRQEAARKELEDYDEVLADADDVPMSPAMRAAIMESDLGPKVAYHLAKNPQEAARLAKLSPTAAAREIGRLEAKLSSTPEPKKQAPPPVSKAPEPIKPVGSKSAPAKKPLTEVTDFDEYYRRRMAGER